MSQFRLIVFDMAGTTVADHGEVETCFLEAAHRTGLRTTPEEILPLRGLSKRQVFEKLWTKQLGQEASDLELRTEASYAKFCSTLENHYETATVVPTEGCLECFEWLRCEGIAIGLTTGFYRKVTDLILSRLGWDIGLDRRRVRTPGTIIQVSVSSDEVPKGRPSPNMIHRVMELIGISEPRRVVKVGDTPSDLLAGRNAGCGLTLGVTNGTHTAEQLSAYPNDGLLGSLCELKDLLGAAQKQ